MGAVSEAAKAKQRANKIRYSKSPEGKYSQQKSQAKARGIAFSRTFEQWHTLWDESGFYSKRGKTLDSYCMARNGDVGAYEVGNVSIVLVQKNMEQQITNKRNTFAKLTPEKIEYMFTARAEGKTQVGIAAELGVSSSYVCRVLAGRRAVLLRGIKNDE